VGVRTKMQAERRKSENYRVYVKREEHESKNIDYYVLLKEALEVQYPGHPIISIVLSSVTGLTLHQIDARESILNTN
jgi:hypothetical protein